MKSILSAILVAMTVTAQTVHTIPFASSGNIIELVVANRSSVAVSEVRVALTHAPVWLKFATGEQTLSHPGAGEERAAVFRISVEQSAPDRAGTDVERCDFRTDASQGFSVAFHPLSAYLFARCSVCSFGELRC